VETPLGRKRRVNEAVCNKDLTCLEVAPAPVAFRACVPVPPTRGSAGAAGGMAARVLMARADCVCVLVAPGVLSVLYHDRGRDERPRGGASPRGAGRCAGGGTLRGARGGRGACGPRGLVRPPTHQAAAR